MTTLFSQSLSPSQLRQSESDPELLKDEASVLPLSCHYWNAMEQLLVIIYPGTIHSYNTQTINLEKIGQEISTIMLPLLAR